MANHNYTYETNRALIISSVLAVVLFLLFVAGYIQLWGWEKVGEVLITTTLSRFLTTIAFAVLLLVGFVAHEVIHAVCYRLAGVPANRIRFGLLPKNMTPYVICLEAVPVWSYRIAIAAPTVLLGLLPLAVGITGGSFYWMLWGAVHSVGGCGDALILWKIRKLSGSELVVDHPDKLGCVVADSGNLQ